MAWRDTHLDVFVLNSSLASPDSSSHALHRSSCWTINRPKPAHGESWTHEYLKACGTAGDVIRFTVAAIRKNPSSCSHCETGPLLADAEVSRTEHSGEQSMDVGARAGASSLFAAGCAAASNRSLRTTANRAKCRIDVSASATHTPRQTSVGHHRTPSEDN